MASRWVQAELNATLTEELSGNGITVPPVFIRDCELLLLLKDRVYADFRALKGCWPLHSLVSGDELAECTVARSPSFWVCRSRNSNGK
jgi:hypothetical protein